MKKIIVIAGITMIAWLIISLHHGLKTFALDERGKPISNMDGDLNDYFRIDHIYKCVDTNCSDCTKYQVAYQYGIDGTFETLAEAEICRTNGAIGFVNFMRYHQDYPSPAKTIIPCGKQVE